jgi:hypothetical protein
MPIGQPRTIKTFIEENNLGYAATLTDQRYFKPKMPWEKPLWRKYWMVNVIRRDAKSMTIGLAHIPEYFGPIDNYENRVFSKKDFLGLAECIISDCRAYEDNKDNTFDFMAEFGYTDPHEAENVFNGCKREAQQFRAMLGDKLYEDMLANVYEREEDFPNAPQQD